MNHIEAVSPDVVGVTSALRMAAPYAARSFAFVLVATGRESAGSLGLDEAINVYR